LHSTAVVFAFFHPDPGLKAVLIGLFFRGLKPPAPSGIRNLKLKLIGLFFRGLKPPAPSGSRNLKLKLIGLFSGG
jgi:hypothetical protein